MWKQRNSKQKNEYQKNNNRLYIVVAVIFLLAVSLIYQLYILQIKNLKKIELKLKLLVSIKQKTLSKHGTF
jgi:cell division protein FtsI/penicillin-binding protein 2